MDVVAVAAEAVRTAAVALNHLHTQAGQTFTMPRNFGTTLLGMRLFLRYNAPSGSEAMDVGPRDLMSRRQVAYSLFRHFAWNNDSCFPGQETLAQHMGMSVSRVNEYIKELEAAGLIEITRRGQGKTNLYRVNFAVKKRVG